MLALKELTDGTAQKYCEEIDSRIQQYNDSSLQIIEVEKLQTKSKLLFLKDLSTNPNVWPNTSMSSYYKKQAIYCLK